MVKVCRKGVADTARVGSQNMHLLSQQQRFLQVMGNQDGSETGALPKAIKKILHRGTNMKIQGAKGLIQQQHLGTRCQGAGNGHPLLHATGAFPRQQPTPISQTHHVKEIGRALLNLPP